MAKKFPLLSPAATQPSAGPFGAMGGLRKPRQFQKGGKVADTYYPPTGDRYNPPVGDKYYPPVGDRYNPPVGDRYYPPTDKYARGGEVEKQVNELIFNHPRFAEATPFAKGGKVPGFIFGGLFSSTPASSTASQQGYSTGNTNNNIADPAYNTLRGNVLTSANNLDFSDPSKWIEGFNADQQGAFSTVRGNQGSWEGNYGQAQGDINQASAADPTGAGMGYINKAGGLGTGSEAASPFIQQAGKSSADIVSQYDPKYQAQAMDAVAAASNKAFGAPGGPMERINDTFTGGNAAQFGRERHGDVMGNAVYNKEQALDQQLAQMANQGWQSSLTAAGGDLNRQAGLVRDVGSLKNQDITTQQGLGTAAGNLTAQGAQTNIASGQAQQNLGTARQGAGYTDANAQLSIGNQQQGLGQQIKSLPMQGLQFQQGLAQGWQLPTSSNFTNTSNSSSTGTQTPASGSPFGQIMGGATALLGALGQGEGGDATNVQPTGANPYSATVNPDGTTTTVPAARGGQIDYYGAGGYVPTVTGVRKRNAMRVPPQPGPMGGMGGMQPTGMPGMPPPAPPTAAALNPMPQPPQPLPHPANRRYAQGGVFHGGPFNDEAQDREMVTRAVHQHERDMHKKSSGELTKLRLNRGGEVENYDEGGRSRLIEPRATPGMIDWGLGRGRASLGANYDPTGRYGTLEGGYEHPFGRLMLGVHGDIGKDLGPEGGSARPNWGIGLRGRLDLAEGGEVLPEGIQMAGQFLHPSDPQAQLMIDMEKAKRARQILTMEEMAQARSIADRYLKEKQDYYDGGQVPGYAIGGGFGPSPAMPDSPLNEDAPEGPFGDMLKLNPIGPSQANFGSFGPLAQAPAAASGGGGGGGKSDGGMGEMASMAMKFLPMIMASDERLKDNIERVGTTHNGLKVIDYNYKGSPFRQRGLSAQDVEKKRPEAVSRNHQGYRMVDYGKALLAQGGKFDYGETPFYRPMNKRDKLAYWSTVDFLPPLPYPDG